MATMTQERTERETSRQAQPEDAPQTQGDAPTPMSITIVENGPYVVNGSAPLPEEAITPVDGHHEYRVRRTFPATQTYALCRCGRTKTPPFCDGSHVTAGFDGTETASRESFEERADVYPGPGAYLLDDNRCAFARFCHREDGDVWTLTELSGDERLKEEAI